MISGNSQYSSKVLRTAAICLWVLFVAAFLAMKFKVYYTLPWFDTAMHFSGGFIAALVLYVIFTRLRLLQSKSMIAMIAIVTLGSFAVGFFWEIIEYVVNIVIPTYVFDPIDTRIDLIADTVGAFIASTIIMIRGKRK